MRGAEALASTLLAYVREVRIVRPPAGIKDIRAWVRSGATREEMQSAIDATTPRSLKIKSQRSRPNDGQKGARHGR